MVTPFTNTAFLGGPEGRFQYTFALQDAAGQPLTVAQDTEWTGSFSPSNGSYVCGTNLAFHICRAAPTHKVQLKAGETQARVALYLTQPSTTYTLTLTAVPPNAVGNLTVTLTTEPPGAPSGLGFTLIDQNPSWTPGDPDELVVPAGQPLKCPFAARAYTKDIAGNEVVTSTQRALVAYTNQAANDAVRLNVPLCNNVGFTKNYTIPAGASGVDLTLSTNGTDSLFSTLRLESVGLTDGSGMVRACYGANHACGKNDECCSKLCSANLCSGQ